MLYSRQRQRTGTRRNFQMNRSLSLLLFIKTFCSRSSGEAFKIICINNYSKVHSNTLVVFMTQSELYEHNLQLPWKLFGNQKRGKKLRVGNLTQDAEHSPCLNLCGSVKGS